MLHLYSVCLSIEIILNFFRYNCSFACIVDFISRVNIYDVSHTKLDANKTRYSFFFQKFFLRRVFLSDFKEKDPF